MNSALLQVIFWSSVVPAGLVVVGFFVAGILPQFVGRWLRPLVLAGAFGFALYKLLGQWPVLAPGGGVQSLYHVAGLSVLMAIWQPKTTGQRYLHRMMWTAGAFVLVLWPLLSEFLHGGSTGSVAHYWRNLAAFYFLCLGLWSLLERGSRLCTVPGLLSVPMMSALGMSFLALAEGSALLSQVASSYVALVAGLIFLSLFKPGKFTLDSVAPFVALMNGLFAVIAFFYLDVNPWTLLMFFAGWLVFFLRRFLVFIPQRPLPEAVILSLLTVAPAGYYFWSSGEIQNLLSSVAP